MINYLVMFFRLFVVFLCSFIFALERKKSTNALGFGVYIFIALGACSIAILANILLPENPLALIAAILSGVGFIGAGAIIKKNESASGFINAATIWAFAIFGILIGSGRHFLGIILFILMELILIFDIYLEHHGIGVYRKKLIILTNKIMSESKIKANISQVNRPILLNSEYNKLNKTSRFVFYIQGKKTIIDSIPLSLSQNDWVENCSLEDM